MKPTKGQHIHILFTNGTTANGIVELWSDKESHLKSNDNDIIIYNTIQNVMMIMLLNKEHKENNIEILQKKFEETYQAPSGDELRDKNLVQLKNLLNKQEKENIALKLRSHHITDVAGVKYGVPGFFEKQGT